MGWRIPFLIGALLALVALYMRRSMEESEVFDAQAGRRGTEDSSCHGRAGGAADDRMTSGITAAHYTWTSYISTYAITQKDMNPDTAYWMLVVAQLIALVSLPFWGLLSDRIGRRPMLFAFAGLMFVLQFPLTAMITSSGWTLLVATTTALLVVSIPASVLSATLSESFPTKLRTQAIGFAYSISVAVFGGSSPYLNQLLVGQGIGWAFSIYIMVLCAFTGIACMSCGRPRESVSRTLIRRHRGSYPHTAPPEADPTSLVYFARTPRV